jgi:hypothetical protein
MWRRFGLAAGYRIAFDAYPLPELVVQQISRDYLQN